MMAPTTEAKSVRTIFMNMDYSNDEENCNLAKAWIEKQESILPKTTEEIQKKIQKNKEKSEFWGSVPAADKYKLLNKLASEIERHTTLICQIELYSRQILTKDTKNKSLPLTTDYIRYYSGWTYLIAKQFKDYRPYGVCGAYLSDDTPLSILGAILAPAVAAGNSIILGGSSKIATISRLIAELCKNVGFPEDLVTFVPVENCEEFVNNPAINKILYVGNLLDKNVTDMRITTDKYLTLLHLPKSSAIIFDTADIDSAIDSIVETAWSYKTFPFGINQLYVQESIFTEVVNRLKTKISKLNIADFDNYLNKNADILISNEIIANKMKVDYLNKIPLQIGSKIFGSSILSQEANNILSILAFRTAKEAIALNNNCKFGSATSVWTENINLATEVSFKLESSIVWINTHGCINASTSFSPIKSSGKGYFGGKEGLLEYLIYDKLNKKQFQIDFERIKESHLPNVGKNKRLQLFYGGSFRKSESGLTEGDYEYPNRKDVRNCVEIAKKSYETWNKIQLETRKKCIMKLADLSESLKIKNAALVEKWIEYLREWAILYDSNDSLFQKSNPELKIIKEALGVVAINILNSDLSYLNLIISAIMSGNAIILVNYADDEFLLELCKIISSSGITPGILNVIYNPNADVVNCLLTHREIATYFSTETKQVSFKQMQSIKHFTNVNLNSFDILKLTTSNKCILTSVGESFL